MNMDFTVELGDDEVLTLTVDDAPKKRVRIQVESLTVRGRFSSFESVAGSRSIYDTLLSSLNQDDNAAALKAIGKDAARQVSESLGAQESDEEWPIKKTEFEKRQKVEMALLGWMRDHPGDPLTTIAVSSLSIDNFKFLRHQFVFGAIQTLRRRGEDVSTKTIVAECDQYTSKMHSSCWIQPWFVDAIGGDLDPIMCYTEIVSVKYPAEK